tara:strand:+ start:949 stop:1095 length:147 start_codon:yes stop_codon:yes gene_type:complete
MGSSRVINLKKSDKAKQVQEKRAALAASKKIKKVKKPAPKAETIEEAE